MMTAADAADIVRLLKTLPEKPFLKGTSRSWWPKYFYHYTDINNAVRVVKAGKLISRSMLEKMGAMPVDNASPEILKATRPRVKDYVRLYFRPRTPTQWHNEGMRPVAARPALHAHCPVPIFFLFNAEKFISTTDCYFSEGNMAASNVIAHQSATSFKFLPFNQIYHEGSLYGMSGGEKRQVIFHRNAEIIVPDELSLESLEFLFCRSPAEKETLVHLLPEKLRQRWAPRIVVDSKLNLFFRSWSFVETVSLGPDVVKFTFFPDSMTPGPFDLKYETVDTRTLGRYSFNDPAYQIGKVPLSIRVPTRVYDYEVKLRLGDDLAYHNAYKQVIVDVPW